jgi:hypothetical protein
MVSNEIKKKTNKIKALLQWVRAVKHTGNN